MKYPFRTTLTILIAAAGLRAQGALDLKSAIEQALRTHPALTAAREQVNGARQLTVQASLKPNPRFNFQAENTRAWGSPSFSYTREADTYAYFSQIIETAGKRARRTEFATAAAGRVDAERAVLERQIASRVALAYWNAVGSERARDLLADELSNLRRTVDYTRARVQEGAAPGVDLLRMQLEFQRVETLAQTAAQDAATARIHLFREMGAESDTGMILTDALDRPAPLDFPNIDDAVRARPEVHAAERAVEQAGANLKLQQANATPDLDFVAGYKRTMGFNTAIAGIQVPLAIRNRNQGQIGAASAEVNAARANLRAIQNQVRADWLAARKTFESRRTLAVETLPSMARGAAELARIAEAAYREGGVELLRLLDTQRARIETQLQYSRALVEYQQSIVNFQVAAGVNP